MSENQPVYQVRDLQKNYNERTVLALESLDVYPGEILALVGPSGAGKSTLLRLLNFLEAPSQGFIEFQGARFEPGQEMPLAQRRRVTTVFQRPMLLNQSVIDNVTYGLRLRGERKALDLARQALTQVGLEGMQGQRARSLSGGEAQRVALARAIVLKPAVLLLDEPTANLDPYNVGLIEDIVRQANRRQEVTVVLVTHNVFQARRLAHRVAFLLSGKLVEVAEVEPFFQSPQDERTRAFTQGEMVY
ncbi:MAG: phosphate ABC transporter ATP-binding protein [Chloroflexota bacterium]